MFIAISILIVIASLLLVFIVVIQNSKGGGLAAGFSSSNQVMGVRKTTDFLEKATWGLAATVVVLCIISSSFIPKQASGIPESEIKENIQNATPINPNAVSPFETPIQEGAPAGENVPAAEESVPAPNQE